MRKLERGGNRWKFNGFSTPGADKKTQAGTRSWIPSWGSQRALSWVGQKTPTCFSDHQGRAVSDKELFDQAKIAKTEAHVPMSGFRVGAAGVTKSGRVLTGANLETSDRAGGGGTCAEGAVMFQLRGDELDTIVIASDSEDCITPCGGCCQTLMELAPEARVVMTSSTGEMKVATVSELYGAPETSATDAQLAPFKSAIAAGKKAFEKAEVKSGNIDRRGVAILEQDGSTNIGATRKQSGAFSRATEMAVDARFMADAEGKPKAVVFVGEADEGKPWPLPSGRDRQAMFNLGPDVPVVLVNAKTGEAALTTPQALLPMAYTR